MAGATQAAELTRAPSVGHYDPEMDGALRYPDWLIAQARLGWGLHEVMSLRSRVILLEHTDSPVTQRCSLAHAIAHLDLGHGEAVGIFDARQERQASLLAARRLISIPDLARALSWSTSPAEVAAELHVDLLTLSLRWAQLSAAELAQVQPIGLGDAA